MSALANDIIAYIRFLQEKHGLAITLHGISNMILPHTSLFLPFTIHSNPYCLYVKSERSMWDICIRNQARVCEKCQNGPFFGTCYAGMGEFIVPIQQNKETIGFISVSGYRDPENGFEQKLPHFAEKYGFSRETLRGIFEKNVKTPPPIEEIRACVQPLAVMLELLALSNPIVSEELTGKSEGNYLYESLLAYLHRHFSSPIRLEDLSRQFHCSPSSISHFFKKRSGENISAFINGLRLQEAANLLEKTAFPIREIAYTVGFSDSNYFSSLFHRKYGRSPKAYREKQQKTETEPAK